MRVHLLRLCAGLVLLLIGLGACAQEELPTLDGASVWPGRITIRADGTFLYDGELVRSAGQPWEESRLEETMQMVARGMQKNRLHPTSKLGPVLPDEWLEVDVAADLPFRELWRLILVCITEDVSISMFLFATEDAEQHDQDRLPVRFPKLDTFGAKALVNRAPGPYPTWRVEIAPPRSQPDPTRAASDQEREIRHVFELVGGDVRRESADPRALDFRHPLVDEIGISLRCDPDVRWSELVPVLERIHAADLWACPLSTEAGVLFDPGHWRQTRDRWGRLRPPAESDAEEDAGSSPTQVTGKLDPSEIHDFGPVDDTTPEEWRQMNDWMGTWMDPEAGAAAMQASWRLLAKGRKAFPVILNHLETLDLATDEGRVKGDLCQRGLTEIANGTTFEWRHGSGSTDLVFNQQVVRAWARQWERCERNADYWILFAKLDQEDPQEAARLREAFGKRREPRAEEGAATERPPVRCMLSPYPRPREEPWLLAFDTGLYRGERVEIDSVDKRGNALRVKLFAGGRGYWGTYVDLDIPMDPDGGSSVAATVTWFTDVGGDRGELGDLVGSVFLSPVGESTGSPIEMRKLAQKPWRTELPLNLDFTLHGTKQGEPSCVHGSLTIEEETVTQGR